MKTASITNSQQKRLDFCGRVGEVIFSEVNENGYLNITVKMRTKTVPIKELCYGRAGGLHKELWYEAIDSETNEPIGLIREWSSVQGLIFRKS